MLISLELFTVFAPVNKLLIAVANEQVDQDLSFKRNSKIFKYLWLKLIHKVKIVVQKTLTWYYETILSCQRQEESASSIDDDVCDYMKKVSARAESPG